MPLRDRNIMPPGGFLYTEDKLKWTTPNPYLPFSLIAYQIQSVRVANPTAGLNPALDACELDLDRATCARLKNHPKWCETGMVAVVREQSAGCKTCGKKKKRKS